MPFTIVEVSEYSEKLTGIFLGRNSSKTLPPKAHICVLLTSPQAESFNPKILLPQTQEQYQTFGIVSITNILSLNLIFETTQSGALCGLNFN